LPEYQTGKTMDVYLAKFMLYFQLHRMRQQGHSVSQISQQLELNRRTVKKYLSMDEAQYEAFFSSQSDRKKVLLPYGMPPAKHVLLSINSPSSFAGIDPGCFCG
jgi:hypothetical protein